MNSSGHKPQITLQCASLSDMPALAEFAAQKFVENFGHLYEPSYLNLHLARYCSADYFAACHQSGEVLQLAVLGDALVGYVKAGGVGLPTPHAPSDAEIHRLYVAKEAQGTGTGKALMHAAIDALEQRGATTLWLGVWEHNKRAQHFYAQHGFRKVSDYLYRVGPHADREWIMRRG